MKSYCVLLICSISWYILECKADEYEGCGWLDGDGEDRCFLDDSGHSYFYCSRLSDVTKNVSDYDTLVWLPAGRKTECKKPFIGCKCFDDSDEFYPIQYCKCTIPGGPSKFPPTGVIHWKGTIIGSQHSEDINKTVMGEAHRNSNGQFMKITWTVGKKSDASFEILIPDHKGTYTKYVGSGKEECSVYEDQSRKTLTSIWEKWNTDEVVERISVDGDTQVWKKFRRVMRGWDQTWKWTIKYSEEKNYAIPIAYYHRENIDDDFDDETLIKNFYYTYVPTNGVETFDLHTYCPDVEQWR